MKVSIVDTQNKNKGDVALPTQFSEAYRPVVIKRAVHALQSAARQKYGAKPEAGMRHSSKLSKRRRKYRGCYGFGISRVNRKILSRRGTRMFWVGAFSPQTRGGRRAHPPKSEKNLIKSINKKENRLAIRSAIAATFNKELVAGRGHRVPDAYPFVVDAAFEQLAKAKDVHGALTQLGFAPELERGLVKKVRAGLGKMRGRRYRRAKSVLIVVSGDCPLLKSAANLAGVDVVAVTALNAEVLAPGADAGRITLWTQSAVLLLEEKGLYL